MSGLERLRKVAEAATPGPWQWWQGDTLATQDRGKLFIFAAFRKGMNGATVRFRVDGLMTGEPGDSPDAEFIAAADPTTVLALLDVAEAAEAIASDDYLEQPPAYAQGIRVEEAVALTEAVHRLREVAP